MSIEVLGGGAKPQQHPASEERERHAQTADRDSQPRMRAREHHDSADDGEHTAGEREPSIQSRDATVRMKAGEQRHPGEHGADGDEHAAGDRESGRAPIAREVVAHVFGRTLKNRYAFERMSPVMPTPAACSARTVARLLPATI